MIALPAPRHAAALMAAAAIGLAGLRALPVPAQCALCLPAVAVLGLPHGATDWWIAAERMPRLLGGRRWFVWVPVFGAAYLLAACAAAGLIAACPAAALIAFIAVSAWHFGETDLRALGHAAPPARSAALGALPVAAPALCWPHQVSALIDALGVSLAPQDIAAAGACGVAAALVCGARAGHARLLREQAALLLLNAAAPPLLAFLVYFCCIHAPRQADLLHVKGSAGAAWLIAALAALLIAFAVFAADAANVTLPQQAAQALFWGLAVLTAPHVLCGILLGKPPEDATGGIYCVKGVTP